MTTIYDAMLAAATAALKEMDGSATALVSCLDKIHFHNNDCCYKVAYNLTFKLVLKS